MPPAAGWDRVRCQKLERATPSKNRRLPRLRLRPTCLIWPVPGMRGGDYAFAREDLTGSRASLTACVHPHPRVSRSTNDRRLAHEQPLDRAVIHHRTSPSRRGRPSRCGYGCARPPSPMRQEAFESAKNSQVSPCGGLRTNTGPAAAAGNALPAALPGSA